MLKEKDSKFYNYLDRLVDAKKIRERERVNGQKLI